MEPIEDKHRALMNAVASALKDVFKGYGFTLLVFDLNRHDGRMNYISNANRESMITAMKEFIALHEGRGHSPPEQKH